MPLSKLGTFLLEQNKEKSNETDVFVSFKRWILPCFSVWGTLKICYLDFERSKSLLLGDHCVVAHYARWNDWNHLCHDAEQPQTRVSSDLCFYLN